MIQDAEVRLGEREVSLDAAIEIRRQELEEMESQLTEREKKIEETFSEIEKKEKRTLRMR